MRFKVGDKVRIKSLDWYNENKTNEFGDIDCGTMLFMYEMSEFCNKIVTISNVNCKDEYYEIEEDNAVNGWTDELYEYRLLYNASFFNELAKQNLYDVHKSKKHSDGKDCFGGGWFIVMAELPTGQISNHYELKDWDLFQVPEKEKANV